MSTSPTFTDTNGDIYVIGFNSVTGAPIITNVTTGAVVSSLPASVTAGCCTASSGGSAGTDTAVDFTITADGDLALTPAAGGAAQQVTLPTLVDNADGSATFTSGTGPGGTADTLKVATSRSERLLWGQEQYAQVPDGVLSYRAFEAGVIDALSITADAAGDADVTYNVLVDGTQEGAITLVSGDTSAFADVDIALAAQAIVTLQPDSATPGTPPQYLAIEAQVVYAI